MKFKDRFYNGVPKIPFIGYNMDDKQNLVNERLKVLEILSYYKLITKEKDNKYVGNPNWPRNLSILLNNNLNNKK